VEVTNRASLQAGLDPARAFQSDQVLHVWSKAGGTDQITAKQITEISGKPRYVPE
jgi:hypothetical protein